MLKKAWRLTKNEDFERVFRKGTPLFFNGIACRIFPNTIGHIRLGFSFRKKHIVTAVRRNRLRRTLVEPFLIHSNKTRQDHPVDIVFFSVKKIEGKDKTPFASVAESVVKYISHN